MTLYLKKYIYYYAITPSPLLKKGKSLKTPTPAQKLLTTCSGWNMKKKSQGKGVKITVFTTISTNDPLVGEEGGGGYMLWSLRPYVLYITI